MSMRMEFISHAKSSAGTAIDVHVAVNSLMLVTNRTHKLVTKQPYY